MVLGDPGSGKSTLLRFLALSGLSKPLQDRYKAEPDNRLPVLIFLRRYADELKSRRNLSLLDYIQENIQGDFKLKSADLDFFEYYLETGQALLLFDGLDELPDPQFKRKVRDNIRTLLTTYPGNTAIITSRIVGYESSFRFDDKHFRHVRLTKLQLPEIEQFVNDWYRARIENKRERDLNAADLIRIVRDEAHVAIRELAQNPLLLTIIALVHRIDAVLPDERVILYQKCTETLLNTWHTWKYREPDSEPEDLAEEFLEFVKKRAGLLIEVGDRKYSFVHLTFQEYLTASHIATVSEKDGVNKMWQTISDHCHEPAWQEVIRLLIANLKADESQEMIIDNILSGCKQEPKNLLPQLLGGLLLDGIEPARLRKQDIYFYLLQAAMLAGHMEQLRPLLSILRTCMGKDEDGQKEMAATSRLLWKGTGRESHRTALTLIAYALNWSETLIKDDTDIWQVVLVTPDLYGPILDLWCAIFDLNPQAHWREALRVRFLPRVPERINDFDEKVWEQTKEAFEKEKYGETEVYRAAFQLLFDACLYIDGYYEAHREPLFDRLADLTRTIDAPPLRIAHCIRDLAYGNKSRTEDLVAMVKSDNPGYREIFERCHWILTDKEKALL